MIQCKKGADIKLSLRPEDDWDLGAQRLWLDSEATKGDPDKMREIRNLWLGFIGEHGVYTVEAPALCLFMAGHGDEAQWDEFARDYIRYGIDDAIRALRHGVPVVDILGVE